MTATPTVTTETTTTASTGLLYDSRADVAIFPTGCNGTCAASVSAGDFLGGDVIAAIDTEGHILGFTIMAASQYLLSDVLQQATPTNGVPWNNNSTQYASST